MKKSTATPNQTAFSCFSKPTLIKTQRRKGDSADHRVTTTWHKTCLYIEPTMLKRLKVYGAEHGIPFTKILNDALTMYIENRIDVKMKR